MVQKRTFIDESLLLGLLEQTGRPDQAEVDRVLNKALELNGLTLAEAAVLLNLDSTNTTTLNQLFHTALKIKELIYGNRLVLFAPLYVSNHCSNNCLYCRFRRDNNSMVRVCLGPAEIQEEVRLILEQGHKRILMLMGEHPGECTIDYFLKSIEAAYRVKDRKGSSLRRINVEIAPLTDEEFRQINQMKIGTYTCFQETYHQETYRDMHPSGKKADYLWRLMTMDRALANGLHDVGIGALFGLYDYRFEVLALLQHAQHLDQTYGIGPHTISIPRIEPAQNAPAALAVPHPVADTDFKKLVAVLRCAVPYTGIILSTRESADMRAAIINLGASQLSAGSKTTPGGYREAENRSAQRGQFSLSDTRSTGDVIKSIIAQGFVPSFCTGCYRLGRVGQDFMELAKPGLIKMHCQPNALTTLQEYLEDYADPETKKQGELLIERELATIPSKERQAETREYLQRIKAGERDLYF